MHVDVHKLVKPYIAGPVLLGFAQSLSLVRKLITLKHEEQTWTVYSKDRDQYVLPDKALKCVGTIRDPTAPSVRHVQTENRIARACVLEGNSRATASKVGYYVFLKRVMLYTCISWCPSYWLPLLPMI